MKSIKLKIFINCKTFFNKYDDYFIQKELENITIFAR